MSLLALVLALLALPVASPAVPLALLVALCTQLLALQALLVALLAALLALAALARAAVHRHGAEQQSRTNASQRCPHAKGDGEHNQPESTPSHKRDV